MTESHTYSGTRFSGYYLLLQAVSITAWWAYLWAYPEARKWFVPKGAGEPELLAFFLPDLGVAVLASAAAGCAFFMRSAWMLPLAWFAAGAVVYAAIYCVGWAIWREDGWLNVAFMLPSALFVTIAALDASHGTVPIFRRAAPSRTARHIAATLLQVAAFWTFFLFVVPVGVAHVEAGVGWPDRFSFSGQQGVAVALFMAMSGVGLTSGMTMAARGQGTPLPFDAPNALVFSGPYAYLRNPMVVAGLGQGLAVSLWMGSWAVVAYVLTGGAIWQFLVRPAEERDLVTLHGDSYRRYCDAVPCWVPRANAYRGEER
ncbi:MAG: hypothetical protein AMXMBFR7_50070 [Planctomycetota bacterium]